MTPEELALLNQGVLEVRLHRSLGLELVSQAPGQAVCRIPAGNITRNNAGVVHAGILYALLDVVCYLAVLPLLNQGENAVTHDFHASILRPVDPEQAVEFTGSVAKRGRTLVFSDGEARVDGRLAASARVTKSIVRSKAQSTGPGAEARKPDAAVGVVP